MTRFGVARSSAKLAGVFLVALSVLVAASPGQLKIKLPESTAQPSAAQTSNAQPLAQPEAATAQVQIKLPVSTAELETVLTQGRELETQRRWSEAVSLYEEASRKIPGQPALEERLDLAKIHYDVARRYADTSFRKNVVTLSESEALDLYSQVTSRVYTHYVQPPNWRQLVERGTLGLSVALYETPFKEANLVNVNDDRVANFRRQLQQATANRNIRDRNEARDMVAHVARLAQTHLGLRPAAAVFEYIAGALGGLDEYSTFLTAGQLADIYSQIDGNFVGLGVELKAHENALLIMNVIPGSPADKAGIKRGDRLTGVAGRTTQDLTTDQAAELLQGAAGTTVEVVAVTADAPPRRVTMRREHVEVPSIENARLIDAQIGIAYLKLACFQKTTTSDLDAALWSLYRQGMKSLIIDLRGNPGGLLTSSVEVADKFLEQGSIVSTRGRSANEDFNYTAHRAGTWRVPLVVLIDGDSASASEIFAGAIRDHRRGTVVGVKSYGKGSVQGIFPLTIGGTGVRLTTAKFYSPAGRPYSKVGVEPDVLVRSAEKPITSLEPVESKPAATSDAKDDAILAAGLQVAREQLARASR
jgi:carboxyl-terminal processing protease